MARRPPMGGARPTRRQQRQMENAMSEAAGRAVNLGRRAAGAIWNWVTGGSGREPTRREMQEAAEELVPSEIVEDEELVPSQIVPRNRPAADMDDGSEVDPMKIGFTFFAPNSTNVYSYRYDHINGDLYVTYRVYRKIEKGSDQRPNEPGVTYKYFKVPGPVWEDFRRKAQADMRGGEEVWDHLRQRGTINGTQYQYSLVEAQETAEGTYVPRRATNRGFKRRAVIDQRNSRRGQPVWDESNLPDQDFRSRRTRRRRGN